MNPLNIYNHHYNKAFLILKRILISELKVAKKKNRPFTTVSGTILRRLYNYRIEKYEIYLNEIQKEAYKVFDDRYSFYDGDTQQVIQWVLEDEVYAVFKGLKSERFNYFVIDLGVKEALKEVSRHFQNYHGYYELIYELDYYQYFYLKDFDRIRFESSQEYNEMMDIKYPERIEKRLMALKEDGNKNEEISPKKGRDASKNNVPSDENKQILINDFTDDERFIMIHIFYNKLQREDVKDINLTDFMKFMKIAGSYQKVSVFNKKAKSDTTYTKVSKGLDYYGDKTQLKIINEILDKLNYFDFDFISSFLKIQKRKLNETRGEF